MASHAERLGEIADWHENMAHALGNSGLIEDGARHYKRALQLRAAAEAFEKLGHAPNCAALPVYDEREYSIFPSTPVVAFDPSRCNCPQSENAS